MPVTKEQVLVRATELGVTLTDEQIQKHVADGTLPEKESPNMREEFRGQSSEQLITLVLETRSEAAERRRQNKVLKEQVESLTREVQALGPLKDKTPELEAQLKKANESITAMKDAEKARRNAVLATVPEAVRKTIEYMGDVDKISSNEFDATVELLVDPAKPGARRVPNPSDPPTLVNPFSKKHFNLTEQIRLKRENPAQAEKLQREAATA